MYVNFDSVNYKLGDVAKEMKRSNDLKEKELKYIKDRDKRMEWLDRLKRMPKETLLEMLHNTEEFFVEQESIMAGSLKLYQMKEYKVSNPDYIDIKYECMMRGIIKD